MTFNHVELRRDTWHEMGATRFSLGLTLIECAPEILGAITMEHPEWIESGKFKVQRFGAAHLVTDGAMVTVNDTGVLRRMALDKLVGLMARDWRKKLESVVAEIAEGWDA